ncbi:hypothetical protein HYH03_013013 [Edaphochlamys debaryana]|uniref:Uncharacterized protein n=1 Tax=Edaphochlamys debaryana TaxID=47281 RepID=A0A835XX72_9CHLO|nr:hypothetical protein HYH03_013013 [Edaphochlamys debaryana]|eukprot:KAG2488510.1 hypothetical protein HYH03_013013 [Edaphochlamys debaryana]
MPVARPTKANLFHKEDPIPLDPKNPELVSLRSTAGFKTQLSLVALLIQGGLCALASVILYQSFGAIPTGRLWPRLFTMSSIACSFVSIVFAQVLMNTSQKMSGGETISPSLISGNLLRCMVLNIVGVVLAVFGLQSALGYGAVEALVSGFKIPAAGAVVTVDLFKLQAATNVLLSHAVSLAYLNTMFSLIRKARYPKGGVALGSWDGLSPH